MFPAIPVETAKIYTLLGAAGKTYSTLTQNSPNAISFGAVRGLHVLHVAVIHVSRHTRCPRITGTWPGEAVTYLDEGKKLYGFS